MSTTIPLPSTRQPLLRALSQAKATPKLTDYPALQKAAIDTKAELDTHSESFAAAHACVETLSRFRLSASSALMLMVLAKHGTLHIGQLAALMRHTGPSMTQLTTRMEQLSLVKIQRGQPPDVRRVHLSITDAGRKVLASLSALTGLGAASSILLKPQTPRA